MKTIWKILIGIVIIAVIVGGYLVLRRRSANHANQSKYTTVEVKRGSIVVKILATGTVQPYTRVEFRSPVSGRIESVVVDERAKVKPGDVLAWISSEDRTGLLDAARSGLKLAQRAGDTSVLSHKSLDI